MDKASDWRLQMELLFPPEIIKIPNFLAFLLVCGLYYATFTMMLAVGIEYYSFIEEASPIISAIKVFPLTVGLVFGATIYRASYYEKIGLKNMFILSSALTLGSCIWMKQELHARFQSIFYVIMGFHATVVFIMVLFVRNSKKKEEPESEVIDDSVKDEDVCVSIT
ncbi:hypothetical protein PMKS-003655 [Pichia membranifaciens]|uniref:Uncharacterized protein n=1 Tax=Pichia membranifaciens TaxID=4926 RepID=A0A1Q2YKS8_9ASCO|nr:hypothetical protein PMKS-003655 [Pichia membranifaciens]